MNLRKLAENHVDWLLSVMREPMIQEFIHGFKHGYDAAKYDDEIIFPENYHAYMKNTEDGSTDEGA